MAKPLMDDPQCPMDLGIMMLAGKWKLPLIWTLYSKHTVRFNELQRLMGTISAKTLSSELQKLEARHIITRKVTPTVPPQVSYSLTNIGLSLEPVLNSLCSWASTIQAHFNNSPSLQQLHWYTDKECAHSQMYEVCANAIVTHLTALRKVSYVRHS